MDNPVFIVGLPRSGSTLWLNIIAQNRLICRIGEMLYLTPWRKDIRYFLKKTGKLVSDEDVKKMVDLMFSCESLQGLTGSFWYNEMAELNNDKFKEVLFRRICKSDRSLESIFKSLIEEMTAFKGCKRFCMKFPVYVNYIPQLVKWYPDCKIIHIVRDPRAMAMSRTNDPGGTKIKINKYPYMRLIIKKTMILFVIVQYVWTSRLHCKYKKFKNYKLFKFEDLLAEPGKVINDLCKFIEIDFVPDMLNPKEGQASSVTGKKQKGFNEKAAVHWRKVISPFEERTVTFLTKNSMKRFEYNYKKHPVFLDE